MAAGAVRPSQSTYSSKVVIAQKKDGSISFCVDLRKLDNKTVKDAFAIPWVEVSLHLLAGAIYFSKSNLRSGYGQVELKEEDKHKTAFQMGDLGFLIPFGLYNAPAIFQRIMERCMGELNLRDCLIFLDDVIIFSTTFGENLERLEAVFLRLKQNTVKSQLSERRLSETTGLFKDDGQSRLFSLLSIAIKLPIIRISIIRKILFF